MPRQEFRQDSRSEPLRSDPHEQRLSDDELQVFRQRCQAYSGEELDDLNDGLLPKTVGRFEICEQIGSGSFGTVYLAFDRKLTRNVAVKVAHIGAHSSARLRARFLREAHAAARLAHQNVVSLHEYGDEGGLLYLVYEMCDGPTLEHWMAEQPDRTAPRVAVAIVRELASGLAHAHSRGLVHRDVKPGNVLLQPKGEPGGELPFTPRITDFGLAHDFLARDQKSLTAGLFGTIDYMSPEQAQGDPESIRPSSDLYALGVLLYRLLTGVLPFAGSNIVETLQRICVEPPVAPRRINPAIAKDLEAICLKCLSKKPEGRYTSCAALAQDLGRYLQGAVVQARPQSRFERGCRLLAAHPLVSTLTASIIVICLISVGIFSKMDRDLRAQHAELQQTLSELMASQAIAGKAQMSTFEALAVLELQRDEAKRQALKALRSSYRADLQQAYGAWGDGRVLAASELLRTIAQNVEGHLDLGCDYRLLAASVQAVHRRLAEHEAPATEIQAIPGSDWLVSAGHDGRLHFHNRLTGQLEHVAKAIEGFVIDALAVSPDGKRIAVSYTQPALGMGHAIVHGLEPNSDQSWLVNSKIIHFAPSTIESLSFSACGRFLAIGPRYSTVSLYSLEDSAVTGRVPTHGRNRCLSFSPDGKHCLVAGKEALLQVVDSATGQVEREVPCARVPHYAVWSPAGDCLAYVDYGSDTVYLCTSTGSELQRARLKQPYGTIESLAFSPDGSLLSAGTQRGGVAVWDVLPGLHVEGGEYNERYAAIVHNACVPAVCLPDNGHLLSVSESGAVLETRLEEQSFGFLEHDAIVSCTLRLPDRELMLVGEADGKVLSCTMEGETQQVLFAAHGRPVSKLCVGPQGRWVAAGWEDGRLALLDRHTGEVQECGYLPPQDSLDMRKIKDLSFSDDGELLVACGDDARLRMWKVGDSSQPLWEYRARSLAYAVCFVGAEQVALGGMFEEILLFDAHSGAALRSIDGASRTSCLLYDSHFKRLISGHDDGRIRIYDTPDFKLCATLDGDVGGILSLMISPSRECYLSGDSAGKLKVWNAEDCVPLGTLTNFQPNVRIRGIEFCPSRHTLLLHNEVQSDGGACRNGFSRIAIQPGLSQHMGSAIK